jgi:hypothetical protein
MFRRQKDICQNNNAAAELERLREEVTHLKKELEDKKWASNKTSEGIKFYIKNFSRKTRN